MVVDDVVVVGVVVVDVDEVVVVDVVVVGVVVVLVDEVVVVGVVVVLVDEVVVVGVVVVLVDEVVVVGVVVVVVDEVLVVVDVGVVVVVVEVVVGVVVVVVEVDVGLVVVVVVELLDDELLDDELLDDELLDDDEVPVGSVPGAASGVRPLTTKLFAVNWEGSSPIQMEQGWAVPGLGAVLGSLAASQQLTVEPGSKPPGWLLLGSKLSGVLPVGSSHRYMVMVKLPSALGTTEVVPPTLNFDSVRPSHSDCEVGSRSHSSVSTAVPALRVLFAATVIVSTAASPLYWPDGNEGFGAEKTAVVCGVG